MQRPCSPPPSSVDDSPADFMLYRRHDSTSPPPSIKRKLANQFSPVSYPEHDPFGWPKSNFHDETHGLTSPRTPVSSKSPSVTIPEHRTGWWDVRLPSSQHTTHLLSVPLFPDHHDSSQSLHRGASNGRTLHMPHVPHAAMCTPQTSRAETDLRARVDQILCCIDSEQRRHRAPPVTQLTDYLFIGGAPTEETVHSLKQCGVDFIINVVSGENPTPQWIVDQGFFVEAIDSRDQHDYYILTHHYEHFRQLVNLVRSREGRVFVHCIAGVNRSVTLCAAYLMEYEKLDVCDVIELFRQQGRPVILDNKGFRRELVDFYVNTLVPRREQSETQHCCRDILC